MHPPMPVLTRVLMAVCCTTLVTTMLPLLYLPNALCATDNTSAKVYDEYGQRTTLIFDGGHAELENCVKVKINFPDDLKQLAGSIQCGGHPQSLPELVLPRIAYSLSSSSNAQTCPSPSDSQCQALNEIIDTNGTPHICTVEWDEKYAYDECVIMAVDSSEPYKLGTYQFAIGKKCDNSLFGFRILPTATTTKVHLDPGTVILVNKTESDILIDAYHNDMSCQSPDLNVPQIGTTQSRVELDRLTEDKLARVYCNLTGRVRGTAAHTYFFVGLNEISIDCSAVTGSKCKAPAWMNMRQDNLNEVYDKGQVQCSLKTQMQLCFPIITNVTTPNKTAVCTTTGPDATTDKLSSTFMKRMPKRFMNEIGHPENRTQSDLEQWVLVILTLLVIVTIVTMAICMTSVKSSKDPENQANLHDEARLGSRQLGQVLTAETGEGLDANVATHQELGVVYLDGPKVRLRVQKLDKIGSGSFGQVYKARIQVKDENTETIVALKDVVLDKIVKLREVRILRGLQHVNIIRLMFYYVTEAAGVQTLSLLIELMASCMQDALDTSVMIAIIEIKLWSFQLLRALEYMHGLKVCHRDIKPQNLLLDRDTGLVKVGDFGSAKQLHPDGECTHQITRPYRPPELIYRNRKYTTQVDMWSCGCVLGQLFTMKPLYPVEYYDNDIPGNHDKRHIVMIEDMLGSPSEAQCTALNPSKPPSFAERSQPKPWTQLLPSSVPESGCLLLSRLLQWAPSDRLQAAAARAMPFFDDVRHNKRLMLPSGKYVDQRIYC